MAAYITLDPSVVSVLKLLGKGNVAPEFYGELLEYGIRSLENGVEKEDLMALAEKDGGDTSSVTKVVQASSILYWELTKGAPKELAVISEAFQDMGINNGITEAFLQQYNENRLRLNNLKGALSVSVRRYKDLEWRLEMELARRDMTVMTQPKYLLRLDLFNQTDNASGKATEESFHLQVDHANLKYLHSELERALGELSSTHGQRMSRYIR